VHHDASCEDVQFRRSSSLHNLQLECQLHIANAFSCLPASIHFEGATWLDDDGQPQNEASPGEQLRQKDVTTTFRTPRGMMQHSGTQAQAAINRYQQLDSTHQRLLIQHKKVLVGQSAYVLDQTAVACVYQTGGRKPKGHWITFNELVEKHDQGLLSVGQSQRLQHYCQTWSDAGLSLEDLKTISANLKEMRFAPGHPTESVDGTTASADDLLWYVPACCHAMGRRFRSTPGIAADICRFIKALRDNFTSSGAVLCTQW